jgi:hypothetical protein
MRTKYGYEKRIPIWKYDRLAALSLYPNDWAASPGGEGFEPNIAALYFFGVVATEWRISEDFYSQEMVMEYIDGVEPKKI